MVFMFQSPIFLFASQYTEVKFAAWVLFLASALKVNGLLYQERPYDAETKAFVSRCTS